MNQYWTRKMATEEIHMTTVLLLFCSFLVSALSVDGLSYDYSYTIECLANPHKPQYGGGIVANPEFNHGLESWAAFGGAKIEHRVSQEGNKFIAAFSRRLPNDSFSQTFYLEKEKLYAFSAWFRVSEGETTIVALFNTATDSGYAGSVIAKSGCWSMLKGGFVVNTSGPAKLLFLSKNTRVEIWADSISLQPFTEEQWTSHQNQTIDKFRKSPMKLGVLDAEGKTLANATVSVSQLKANFPLGCLSVPVILQNPSYQKWFTSRFSVTTFGNAMKWYATESARGKENYSVPDAMVNFFKRNNIQVRGHNILWDDGDLQPRWVQNLPLDELRSAVDKRISSVVRRYRGRVIAWDVMNENLHYNFYESKFGPGATTDAFIKTNQLDRGTPLFLNEFNTIEYSGDVAASPAKYIQKIKEMRAQGYTGPMAIGLESHFAENWVNLPYVRASMDKLGATGLPIWATELDVSSGPKQVLYLEQVLREVYAHPSVKGIVVWTSWPPETCYRMCLTDYNFKNLPTGDVVDKLIAEWSHTKLTGTTDSKGHYEARLFHGDYEVTITHPDTTGSSVTQNLKVIEINDDSEKNIIHITV